MKVPSLISKSHTNKKMNFYIFHEIWKSKQFFLYCKNIFIHYFSIGIWKTKKPKGTAVGSGIHSRTWITSRGSKRNLKTLLQVTYFFVRITIKIWKSREIGETPFLLGVTALWHVAQWVFRVPPQHNLRVFLNLNGSEKVDTLSEIVKKYLISIIYLIVYITTNKNLITAFAAIQFQRFLGVEMV